MAAAEGIELGWLVRPVGIRGEVKLLPTPDFWPAALDSARLELLGETGGRPVRILSSRPAGNCHVLRLEGVEDRDAAEDLREAILMLVGDLDVAPPTEVRGWQIRGMRVRTAGGEDLGEVTDLLPMPAQPLLQVKGPTKAYRIPFVEPILCGIDWEERTIEIDPPDGLLEL